MPDQKQELLRTLPAITELLKSETVTGWLRQHPQPLVTECLRRALAGLRQQILDGAQSVSTESLLRQAENFLQHATEPHVREAINATGIILHTGLGRAVLPAGVVDSMLGELKGYEPRSVKKANSYQFSRPRHPRPRNETDRPTNTHGAARTHADMDGHRRHLRSRRTGHAGVSER